MLSRPLFTGLSGRPVSKYTASLQQRIPRYAIQIMFVFALISVSASPVRAQKKASGALEPNLHGVIRGSVRDAGSGEPLANVEVRLFIVTDETERRTPDANLDLHPSDVLRGTTTTDNGSFEFAGLKPDSYEVEAHILGFKNSRKRARVAAGRTTSLLFALTEEPLQLDEALVESASMVGTPSIRLDIPGSVNVLSSRMLEKFRYADVHRVLRQIPGMNIQEEDGYGLRPNIGMRGTGSERSAKITVMEDGILMAPAPYSAPAAYYFPTVGRAEQVEVRKGSSQIRYGPYTTGGAINLISRSIPRLFSGMLSTTFGTNAARVVHGYGGASSRNVGFLLEAYEGQTDGFKRVDGGGNTGFDKTDYLAKLRLNTSPGAAIYQAIEFKYSQTDEVSNETYLGLTDSDFDRSPTRRYAGSGEDVMNALHRQFAVTHTLKPSQFVRITTSAYRITFHRNWFKLNKVASTTDGTAVSISDILRDPDQFKSEYEVLAGVRRGGNNRLAVKANNRDYLSRGIQTNAALKFSALGGEHDLNIGARIHADQMDRFQWVDDFRMTEAGMQLASSGIPGTDSNRIESARAFSAYAQQEAEFGRLKIVPGLRYEHVTQLRREYGKADPQRTGVHLARRSNTVDVMIPGLGVSGKLGASTRLFAGVHRGFSPPGSREGTKPESSVNYELGLRHRGTLFSGEVTTFFSDYSNLLGTDLAASGGTGSGDLFNGGQVDASGLEMAAGYNLGPLVAWSISIPISFTYTYTSSVFRNTFDSDYEPWGSVKEGDHLPYVPAHQFSFDIGVEGRRFELSLGSSFVGEMRTKAGQGRVPVYERTDAHFVLDVSGGVTVSPTVRLFASLRNVTDALYVVARRPAGLRPGLPRTFLAGATARF